VRHQRRFWSRELSDRVVSARHFVVDTIDTGIGEILPHAPGVHQVTSGWTIPSTRLVHDVVGVAVGTRLSTRQPRPLRLLSPLHKLILRKHKTSGETEVFVLSHRNENTA